MKSKINVLLAAGIFIAMGMISCKKEASVQTAPVTEEEALVASEENASADAEYDDLTEMGLSVGADLEAEAEVSGEITGTANGNSGSNGRIFLFADLQFKIGPCTKIDVSPKDSSFPKTVTVDYGDGCICRDGKFRKGVVIFYYTGPIRRPGSSLTITLRGYYVNRAHIEGTKTIKNLSENGAVKFSTSVQNGKITWPNGRGFSYEGTKIVTQVRGMETRTIRDDVYSIEGRNKTIYANGTIVIKNTETPLIKPVACSWIVKGLLKIKINDRVLYIDFGNGDCDNKATLKWANGERIINLP
jgi:hypothetical protein